MTVSSLIVIHNQLHTIRRSICWEKLNLLLFGKKRSCRLIKLPSYHGDTLRHHNVYSRANTQPVVSLRCLWAELGSLDAFGRTRPVQIGLIVEGRGVLEVHLLGKRLGCRVSREPHLHCEGSRGSAWYLIGRRRRWENKPIYDSWLSHASAGRFGHDSWLVFVCCNWPKFNIPILYPPPHK